VKQASRLKKHLDKFFDLIVTNSIDVLLRVDQGLQEAP
jgi:hypothetical protein